MRSGNIGWCGRIKRRHRSGSGATVSLIFSSNNPCPATWGSRIQTGSRMVQNQAEYLRRSAVGRKMRIHGTSPARVLRIYGPGP